MKASFVRYLVLPLLCFAAAACGEFTNADDDDDDDDVAIDAAVDDDGDVNRPDASPDAMVDPCRAADVPLEDLWSCLHEGICELVSRCFGAGVTVDACLGAELFVFDDQPFAVSEVLFTNAIANGTMTYDGTRVAECLEGFETATCVELLGSENPFDTCGLFSGEVATNGECTTDSECENVGGECFVAAGCDTACCPGTCRGPAPLGGDCSSVDCAPDAHCVSSVCQSGGTGSPCTSDSHCDGDHFCAASNTCQMDFGNGATCTDDDQCTIPNQCVGISLPGATQGSCQPSASAGDMCDGGCLGLNLWCNQPAPDALGTCEEFPLPGESCAESESCGFFVECDPNELICVPPGEAGAACTDSSGDCGLGLFCDNELTGTPNGTCTASQPAGAECADSEHCQSAVCENGQCVDFQGCN